MSDVVTPLPVKRRFELIPFDKITLSTTSSYLVKGLIPRIGLTVIWGPPKCGKSFFMFDLAMHVALGWEYRGRRVKQGAVVYLALEGAEGFRARVEAFRQTKLAEGTADIPFHLIASPLSLIADHGALIAAIRAALGNEQPAMVAIDTLNRSLVGSESDDRDMAAYVRASDTLRDAFQCAVPIIHHCGVDASRPRGHTSLTGAADAQIAVKRDAADNIIATVEWMKDGPQGEEILSRLAQVEVGQDEDGDPITSCVMEAIEGIGGTRTAARAPKAQKLPKGAKIAFAALLEALDECGELPPASTHIPSHVRTVSRNQWRDYAFRRGISASDKADASRIAFARAAEHLLAGNLVGIWDEWVWKV